MSKGKILVVESDEQIRNMLDIYFTDLGYEVTTFADLSGVIEFGNAETVDVGILEVEDARMLSGKEVNFLSLWESSSNTKNVPLILLSRIRHPDRIRDPEYIGHDYVTKPFDLEEMRRRVRNAIEGSQ